MRFNNKTPTLFIVTMMVIGTLLPLITIPAGADVASRATVEQEPNQDRNGANSINPGDHVTGTLDFADNDDVFKINVTQGKIFNISLYLVDYNPSIPYQYNLDYEVLSPLPDSFILSAHWWQESRNDTYSMVVYETGIHYIWVYANGTPGGDQTLATNYVLSVNQYNVTSVGTGPQSGPLDANDGELSDAWFKLSVAPDQAINVTLTSPGTGDFDLYLYNWWPHHKGYKMGTAQPFVMNASWGRGNGMVESVEGLAMEGTYYVKVSAFSGNGVFSLQINELSYFDDGDSTPANAIDIDVSQTTMNSFHQSFDDVDWYKVHLLQGEHLNLTVDLMSGQGTAVFYVSITDQWQENIGTIGVYDTVSGGAWTNTNTVDNSASLVTVPYFDGNPAESDYYIYVRAVFKVWETGETNFVPCQAMYRISWDMPNYGPDPNGTIPAIVMDEDTSFNDLDLNDYFIDNEGNALSFSYSPSSVANVDINIDQATGMVNITPMANYNSGTQPLNLTFKATDPDADWGKKSSSLNTTLEIKPVNDPPSVVIAFSDVNISEDQAGNSMPADLGKVFVDVDDTDANNLFFRAYGNDNIPVTIDPLTNIMTLGPVYGWSGSENITVVAQDPAGLKVEDTFTATITHVNHPPRSINGIIEYIHNVTEDTVIDTTLNVGDLFIDNDTLYTSDTLTYSIEYPLGYSPPFHMVVSLDVDNNLVIEPEENFTGMEEVPIVAKDSAGAKAQVVVKVTITPVNDPPEIISVSPAVEALEMNEGELRKFELVEVKDIDGDNLKYKWFVDGEQQILVPALQSYYEFETAFVPAKGKFDAGTYTLKVQLDDDTTYVSWTWEVVVLEVNRDPKNVKILEPSADAKVESGKSVTLRAGEASDPDQDTLKYFWTDTTEKVDIGEGKSVLFKPKKTGTHLITLRVSDGMGANVTSTVSIKVTEATGAAGTFGGAMLYALIGLIVVIVVVVLLVMVMKRKRGGGAPRTKEEVASSYEAQMWGPQPPSSGPPAQEPPPVPGPDQGPPAQPEPQPAPEPAPEWTPDPRPQQPSDESWNPGGKSAAPPPGPPTQ